MVALSRFRTNIGSCVGEDNQILLVVKVGSFDQPHTDTIIKLLGHIRPVIVPSGLNDGDGI